MSLLTVILASKSEVAETWKLVAGMEAILIVVLFLGWLSALSSGSRDSKGGDSI